MGFGGYFRRSFDALSWPIWGISALGSLFSSHGASLNMEKLDLGPLASGSVLSFEWSGVALVDWWAAGFFNVD